MEAVPGTGAAQEKGWGGQSLKRTEEGSGEGGPKEIRGNKAIEGLEGRDKDLVLDAGQHAMAP